MKVFQLKANNLNSKSSQAPFELSRQLSPTVICQFEGSHHKRKKENKAKQMITEEMLLKVIGPPKSLRLKKEDSSADQLFKAKETLLNSRSCKELHETVSGSIRKTHYFFFKKKSISI